jgi:nucleoside-diphosphate-sugar epimerase
LIYISSDAVFAENQPVISESTLPCPNTLYGVMHLAREMILQQAAASANVPLLILRPCAIYGPGDTHNSYGPNRFLKSALSERKIKLFGEGEEKRPHVHISDVVELILGAADSSDVGVVHAIPPRSISFLDVAKLVRSMVGLDVEIEFQPRNEPPTHKHFESGRLKEVFPNFEFRSFGKSLAEQFST